jgi:hypothetical protein
MREGELISQILERPPLSLKCSLLKFLTFAIDKSMCFNIYTWGFLNHLLDGAIYSFSHN